MTAFLTRTDLHHLTGHSRRAGMQEWLTREGIPFIVNNKGELVVLWKHVHARLEGKPSVRFAEPDFSSLAR